METLLYIIIAAVFLWILPRVILAVIFLLVEFNLILLGPIVYIEEGLKKTLNKIKDK